MRLALTAGRRALWVGLLLLMATVVAGCGGPEVADEAPVVPERVGTGGPSGSFASAHANVCASATASAAGDDAGAAASFDDAHAGLHELAAAVESTDRAMAARLLEAKERVEQGGDATARRALATVVRDAIVRLGGPAPAECAS